MGSLLSEEGRERWREQVLKQKESGLSIAEWCRSRELKASVFYYWRDRLFPKELDGSAFLEIIEEKKEEKGVGITLEYRGAQIYLEKEFEPGVLKRCLEVLKEVLC